MLGDLEAHGRSPENGPNALVRMQVKPPFVGLNLPNDSERLRRVRGGTRSRHPVPGTGEREEGLAEASMTTFAETSASRAAQAAATA